MPESILIEHFLHQLLHALLGLLARLGQDRCDIVLADDFAHRALGHLFDGGVRVLNVEQVLLCVLDAPVDDEIDVDDVLVAGQHQAFFRHIARAGPGADRRAHADLDDVLPRYLRQAHLFDRIGEAEMQPGCLLPLDFAKAHHNAQFVRVHTKCKSVEGNDGGQHNGAEKEEGAGNAGAARHDLFQPVLAALEELFQIGLLVRASGRALAPGAATPALPCDRRHSDCSKAFDLTLPVLC